MVPAVIMPSAMVPAMMVHAVIIPAVMVPAAMASAVKVPAISFANEFGNTCRYQKREFYTTEKQP